MDVIRSVQELTAIRDEWDSLAAPQRTPLVDFDWFVSCAEALHPESSLRVVVLRRNGGIAGVAPLALERGRLKVLGSSSLYEPSGWIYRSDTDAPELLSATLNLGDPIELNRIPAGSTLWPAVAALPRHRALTAVQWTAPSLGIATATSWVAYYSQLSSRITGNLKRVRSRAIKAFGKVTVDHLEPRPEEVGDLLATFAAIEGSGWKGRNGSSLRQRPDLLAFFQRYCERAARRGVLRLSRLSFGSQLAAAELSVEAYERHWQLKIGYDDALRSYYPGLQLTEATVRRAFDKGLMSYEFLGSAAEWERRWHAEERRYKSAAIYPVNLQGAVGACADIASAAWRQVRKRFAAPADAGLQGSMPC